MNCHYRVVKSDNMLRCVLCIVLCVLRCFRGLILKENGSWISKSFKFNYGTLKTWLFLKSDYCTFIYNESGKYGARIVRFSIEQVMILLVHHAHVHVHVFYDCMTEEHVARMYRRKPVSAFKKKL